MITSNSSQDYWNYKSNIMQTLWREKIGRWGEMIKEMWWGSLGKWIIFTFVNSWYIFIFFLEILRFLNLILLWLQGTFVCSYMYPRQKKICSVSFIWIERLMVIYIIEQISMKHTVYIHYYAITLWIIDSFTTKNQIY